MSLLTRKHSRDVTVSFQLFNVGTSAAVDVELNENGFKVRVTGSKATPRLVLNQCCRLAAPSVF